MVRSHRFLRLAAAGLLAAGLAACGGGGGSAGTGTGGVIGSGGGSTTPNVDKYVGTWVRCVTTGSTSQRETLTLNKNSSTTMVFSDLLANYNNSSCTGTGVQQPSTSGSVTFVGTTQTIGSETLDEITIQNTGSTSVTKQVIEVRASDAKLYLGNTSGTLDASGYPTTLDPNGGYTKQ